MAAEAKIVAAYADALRRIAGGSALPARSVGIVSDALHTALSSFLRSVPDEQVHIAAVVAQYTELLLAAAAEKAASPEQQAAAGSRNQKVTSPLGG